MLHSFILEDKAVSVKVICTDRMAVNINSLLVSLTCKIYSFSNTTTISQRTPELLPHWRVSVNIYATMRDTAEDGRVRLLSIITITIIITTPASYHNKIMHWSASVPQDHSLTSSSILIIITGPFIDQQQQQHPYHHHRTIHWPSSSSSLSSHHHHHQHHIITRPCTDQHQYHRTIYWPAAASLPSSQDHSLASTQTLC